MTDDLRWRKSSRSQNNPNCVQMAHLGHHIAVRDSKNTDGPTLQFTAENLAAFLARTRDQEA